MDRLKIEECLRILQSGREAAGTEDYEKALETARDTIHQLILNRQHDEVITLIRRLRDIFPNDTEWRRIAALAQGGKAELVLGWTDILGIVPSAWLLSELELRLRLAIEIDPSIADPYWDIAVLKARFDGDFDESERLYRQAVALGYKHSWMPDLQEILNERKRLPAPIASSTTNTEAALRELLLELAAFPDRFAPGWIGPIDLSFASPEPEEPAFDSYWRAAVKLVQQDGLSIADFERVREDVAKIRGDAGEYLHDLIRRVSFEYHNELGLQKQASEAHLRILSEMSFHLSSQSNNDTMMHRARQISRRGLRIIETTQSMISNRQDQPNEAPKLVSRAEIDAEIEPAFETIELFFSYSHKDEKLRDKLETHLSLLQREESISTWHDRKIGIGKEFPEEIDQNIERADIILLLVSADFLASEYCYGIEMKSALERHYSCAVRVIPIILRDCEWERAPFANLRVLPTDGKAVTSRKWRNQDEAFLDIARGIRAVVDELRVPLSRISPPTFELPSVEETENLHAKEILREENFIDPDIHADLLIALGQTYASVEPSRDQLAETLRYYMSALTLKEIANNHVDVERIKDLIKSMGKYILQSSDVAITIGERSSLKNLELAYEAAQHLDSGNLRNELAIALANQYLVDSQPQLAENLLRNVLNDPLLSSAHHDHARLTLASSLSEQGKGTEASNIQAALITENSPALNNPSDKSILWMNYGKSLRILGKFEKARDAFEIALESISLLDENNLERQGIETQVRILLGQVLFLLGNVEQGSEEFQKALAILPDGLSQSKIWRYYSLVGQCYFNAKMYNEALPYLDRSRQILNKQIESESSLRLRESLQQQLHDLESLIPPNK